MEFLEKISELEKRISEIERANFMPFKEFQCGRTVDLGTSGSAVKAFSVTFAKAFLEAPKIIATVDEGTDYTDRFGVTIRSTTTTGFNAYVWKADGYGWAQSGLWVNWVAYVPK
jgi:hypothetical protein